MLLLSCAFVTRLRKLAPVGLAALSGVIYFLGFIGWDQWYLEWLAFAPLVLALDRMTTGRRAFFLSWWMGLVTHLGGYYWIVHLLMDFASFPLPLAVLGYVVLCLAQGSLFAFSGWLAFMLHRRTGIALGWTIPVGLVAAEFVWPLIFPSYTANSQAFVPVLTQIADLGGVLLLSGVIALVGGALGEIALSLLDKRPLPRALPLTAAVLVALTLVYGLLRLHQIDLRDRALPTLKVAIVQANVGEADKHLHVREGIARFRDMTDEAMKTPGLGLVVWPESGFNQAVFAGANLTRHVATEVKVPMFVGAVRAEHDPDGTWRHWNSILAVAPGGQVVASYDKIKLLIFGESLPGNDTFPGFFKWLLEKGILPFLSTFQTGTSFAPLPVGPWRLSADVCYEDILPRHISALMAAPDPSGEPPHAMFNGTNDSWYGPVEPRIHLALATFRSIEHRRVPMVPSGRTVYAVLGDWLGWLALAASVFAIVQRRWRPAPTEANKRG